MSDAAFSDEAAPLSYLYIGKMFSEFFYEKGFSHVKLLQWDHGSIRLT